MSSAETQTLVQLAHVETRMNKGVGGHQKVIGNHSKRKCGARSLPSSALSCAPSRVLRTSRSPSRLRALSAVRPYTPGLCPTWCQVGPLLFALFFPNVPPGPEGTPTRRGPAPVPVQDAAYCLRRDMIGSALPTTFRLII